MKNLCLAAKLLYVEMTFHVTLDKYLRQFLKKFEGNNVHLLTRNCLMTDL